jgi:hypothetical protein
MNGFLYFIPNVTAVGADRLEALGLSAIIGRHYSQSFCDSGGPGGAGGVMVRAGGVTTPPRYRPAAQNWWPIAARGHRGTEDTEPDKAESSKLKAEGNGQPPAYWIGLEKASPPGPADLVRDEPLPGPELTLGDGNGWIVPVIRLASGVPTLTMKAALRPDGEIGYSIVDAELPLWELASRIFASFVASGTGEPASPMTRAQATEAAATVLAINYRLSAREAAALGLLNDRSVTAIMRAAVDFDAFVAMCRQAAQEAAAQGPFEPPAGT